MKKLFWFLFVLLFGINMLQSSSLFCTRDVIVPISKIDEYNNVLSQPIRDIHSAKGFLITANTKYETIIKINKSANVKEIASLETYVNIYHYHLVFLLIKSILFAAALLFFIRKAKDNAAKTVNITIGEFFLISFLAVYPTFYVYVRNILEIPFITILGIATVIYLYFILLNFILKLIIKNSIYCILTAIVCALCTLNFYSYLFKAANSYLNLSLSIIGILYLIYSIKSDILKTVTKVISLILIFMLTFNAGCTLVQSAQKNIKFTPEQEKMIEGSTPRNRDIYIIILDAYSGTDVLKQKFNFDNHEFINELKKEGFYVFDHMYSNYNTTYASIPSILNLDYIENTSFYSSSSAINSALLFQIAKKNGYKLYYVNNWTFDVRNSSLINMVWTNNSTINIDIIKAILNDSIFKKGISKIIHVVNPDSKEQFVYAPTKINTRKLVFSHIIAPHPPYLFDKDGNINALEITDNIDKGYLGYLEYTNKETLRYLHFIMNSSKEKPVVIITGDHGMRDGNIFESMFSTFTAYYNPEQNYEHVKESQTLLEFFNKFSSYEFNINLQNKFNKMRRLRLMNDDAFTNNGNDIVKYTKEGEIVTSKLRNWK